MSSNVNFKYQSYRGVYFKPGTEVVCTDRTSMNYDEKGIIVNVLKRESSYSYEVQFGQITETLLDLNIIPWDTDTEEAKLNRIRQNLQIFISYGSEHRSTVEKVYDELKEKEMGVWMDDKSLIPGNQWEKEIRKTIMNFQIALIFLSSTSLNRDGYLKKEIDIIVDKSNNDEKFLIIPIKLNDCVIPQQLSKWHWLNFNNMIGMKTLLSALEKHAQQLL
jgi:hypothetical protein